MRSRSAGVLTIAFTCLIALTAGATLAQQNVLVVGSQNDANILDPVRLGPVETDVAYKVYSSLVRLAPGSVDDFVGDLAHSWSVSEDGLVYTFELRDDAQWHRAFGQVTGHDVKYSFERLKDENLGSALIEEARLIDEVVVVNDHLIEVHLLAPWPDFLMQFVGYRGGFIVNQQAIEQYADNYEENAVGSGMYTLERWSPREEILVHKNPDYYGEEPFFDVIRYAIILEETVLEVALERGEIDIFYATDPLVQLSVLDNPNLKSTRFLAERMFTAYINVEHPPFDDVRVRQALWYALDKETIAEVGFQGLARPSDTLLGEHIPNRLDSSPYTYDPAYARQLLEEAGFDFANTVINMPMDDRSVLVSPIMQAMWAEIGVRSVTPMVERLQHVDVMTAGDFDVAVRTVSRPTADQVFSWYLEESNIPYPAASRYRNPEFNELLADLRTSVDPERLREVTYRIQELVHEEAPVIPLVNVEWVLVMRPDIEGAYPGVFRITAETIRRDP